MMMKTNRRRFLSGALTGAAGMALPRLARAAGEAAPAALTTIRLNDRLSVISGAGCNVLVATAGDDVLMVDCGRRESGAAMQSAIRALSGGKPVKTLFNTHWHLDNTGANGLFAKDGAQIVAHENTRLWMASEFYVEWQDRTYAKRARVERPTKTFHENGTMDFGGETVEYGYLPRAHTDGDIYVWFKDSNVMAAGGVVTDHQYPSLDYITGGWLGGISDQQQRLLTMVDDDTLIIPSTGAVQRRSDLVEEQKMLSTLFDRLVDMMYHGYGPKDMIDAGATKDFDGQWKGDPKLFLTQVYWGLWGHVRELERIV